MWRNENGTGDEEGRITSWKIYDRDREFGAERRELTFERII